MSAKTVRRSIALRLTDAGRAALIKGAEEGSEFMLTQIALGAGTTLLDSGATGLTDQREIMPIFTSAILQSGHLRMSAQFPGNFPTAYAVTELALMAEGVTFAVWSTVDPTQALVSRTPGVAYTCTQILRTEVLPAQNLGVLAQPLYGAVEAIVENKPFRQSGSNALIRLQDDKLREVALSTHDFPTVQDAVNEAVASGRKLVIEAGTAIPQLTITGRIDIVTRGTVTCNYDGTNGPWIHIPSGADESTLCFDTIDFLGHGVMGILLDAARCNVYVRLAKNQVAQAYAVANRQGVVVSQANDNVIDVTAWNFSEGATMGANAVPRVVTTESAAARNVVRIKAYQTHTVWIDSGTNNTAEYLIVDGSTDNAIYNLSPSVGMKCHYMQYTNGKDEPFVLEGTRPWIGKAVYDGWGFPGMQNCTGAVVDEIVVLAPPDGAPSQPVLRSRDGNTQADISIGRITAWLNVSDITQYTVGAFLQFYVGNVDIRVREIELNLTWLPVSATTYLVVHRNGAVAEFGDVRIRLDDSQAQAQPMYWQYPVAAHFGIRAFDADARDYGWLKFSNVTSANASLPRGQELLGDVMQNPGVAYPPARVFTGTAAPTTGNWNRGDLVVNKLPNSGGASGWRCIASGSPGTWRLHGQAGIGMGGTRPSAASLGLASDTDMVGAQFLDTTLDANGRLIVHNGVAWIDVASSALTFQQSTANSVTDPAAALFTLQQKARQGTVSVEDYLALPGVMTDQAPAIQLADAVAAKTGRKLVFPPGQVFYVSQLFLSSANIDFGFCTITKLNATSSGAVNWGNAADKTTGITNGLLENLVIDCNGQANVVGLRIYGNHTRPRVRNASVIGCDYYAICIGALTSQGDKNDLINGLDLHNVYIESTRGNVSLSWAYSMGIELFPGVTCYDWTVRGLKTRGAIVNKIHAVIGVKLSDVDCEATSNFNPSSSGYFEINNCDNVDVSPDCRFRQNMAGTMYYGLKISGDRITGWGGTASSVRFAGVCDSMAFSGVTDVTVSSDAIVRNELDIQGVSASIQLNGQFSGTLAMLANASVANLTMVNAQVALLRLNQGTVQTFRWSGGRWLMNGNNSRLSGVTSARITGVSIELLGAPQSYALQVDGVTDVTISSCTVDGGGTWDRPFYVSNGGALRVISNILDNLVSSTLTASGSQSITKVANNMVNGTLVA